MLVDASAELLCPKLFETLPTVNEAYKSHLHGNEEVTSQLFKGVVSLGEKAFVVFGRRVDSWIQIVLASRSMTEVWDFFYYPKHQFFHMQLNPNGGGQSQGSILASGVDFDYEGYRRPWSEKPLQPPSVSFVFKDQVKLGRNVLTAGDIDFEKSEVHGDVPMGINTPEKAAALLRNLTEGLKGVRPLATKFMRELDSHRVQPTPRRVSYAQLVLPLG